MLNYQRVYNNYWYEEWLSRLNLPNSKINELVGIYALFNAM